jgi:DnaJ like chaperone protein
MTLREYFTKHMWLGKCICAFFGFLMAGPIGALFGLLIGNFFDKGLNQHFSKPFWFFNEESDKDTRNIFFESLFSIFGHIAKKNGRVNELDIKVVKNIMHQMQLNAKEEKLAQQYFNNGKNKNFNLYSTLNQLHKAISQKPNLIRLFVDTQYQYIKKTNMSIEKLDVLNNVLASLRVAPLQNQYHFTEEFKWYTTREQEYRARHNSRYSYNNDNRSSKSNYNPFYSSSLDDPYKTLGIESTASEEEVRLAYRRQISKHHPDKLIAKGLPEKDIKIANEKSQRISKAYANICKMRGWR